MAEHEEENEGFKEEPSMERRLVLRLLKHWRLVAKDRLYPQRKDFIQEDLPDIWPHVFILELGRYRDDPVFVHVGPTFTHPPASMLMHSHVSLVPEKTLIAQSASYHAEVVEQRVAINRGGEFVAKDDLLVKYRSILLPLSENGKDIDALLGAANYKEEAVT